MLGMVASKRLRARTMPVTSPFSGLKPPLSNAALGYVCRMARARRRILIALFSSPPKMRTKAARYMK